MPHWKLKYLILVKGSIILCERKIYITLYGQILNKHKVLYCIVLLPKGEEKVILKIKKEKITNHINVP